MNEQRRLNYAFAVGRVKALEKYLLPQKLFIEALEAGALEDSLKIIYEAGHWSEEMIQARKPEDIDNLSHREMEKVDRLVAELVESEVLSFYQARKNLRDLWLKAQKTGYPFLVNYARHRLDLANIKTFLRFHYRGESADKLEKNLLPGGHIEPRLFKMACGQPWADLHPLLMKTDYGWLWEKSLLALEERNTFIVMEREIENFLIRLWRQAKEITFGPEPVLAYAMARLHEIELVRLIIIGRMLHLPAEMIRERLSETYV